MTDQFSWSHRVCDTQVHLYQHGRVKMFFKNLCALVLWTKVASALEGLRTVHPDIVNAINYSLENNLEIKH